MILGDVCKGWNEMRREKLCTELSCKTDGKPWEHQLVQWRMRPALLASASSSADEARHSRWKELCELTAKVFLSLRWRTW